jgi:DNA-binding GntR family transcriptional regulator
VKKTATISQAKPMKKTAPKIIPRTPLNKTPRRSVLSDEIHDMIKAMIFSHEIAPGQRVNIDVLAVRFEVSQTPIREALARLESEGLIAKEPLKGFSATNLLTLKEFDDLFQFRLLVEPWAAEQAAKMIDGVGKAALKAEMHSAKTALKFKDNEQVEALTEHDARFHSLVARISGNQSVLAAFERTHCHLHLFRLYLATQNHLIDQEMRSKFIQDLFGQYYQSDSGQLAIKQHEQIADAIIKQNSKLARSTMFTHIGSSLRRFSPAAQALNEISS